MSLWFADVKAVHMIPGRLRVRYRLAPGAPDDQDILKRNAALLPGATQIRVAAAARTLAIIYDRSQTTAAHLLRTLRLMEVSSRPCVKKAAPPEEISKTPTLVSLAVLVAGRVLPPPLRLALGLYAAAPIFRAAGTDYREEGLTSHVLEALAISISLARADFTAANTTSFLLNLGEYMEESIARRSEEMLKNLLRPASPEVWVLHGEEEIAIPADAVRIGDKVVVGQGAAIPVDGTVCQGVATVNEASMTGESAPVPKKRGAKVLSGTLVEEGRLVIRAENVGAETAAARIADYVEQSLKTKSNAQLEAARMADQLVPTVLNLAGASFVLSGGNWRRAASVLQGDYSCALKLSTPVAFKSAMYYAGRSNILIKGAAAMERLSQADVFVFDKTGTLTTGNLRVTDAIVFDEGHTPDDLICLAASVEEHYFHPLAEAVVAAAKTTNPNRHFPHKEVRFIVAHGVASTIDDKRIVVGSRHFIEEDEGIPVSQHEASLERLSAEGKTLLYVGFDNKLLGVLALRDSLRDNTVQTIRRLRALGVGKIIMLSGDHKARAEALATELGLDDFHAELLPEDKARIVGELMDKGEKVAFIGDGVNDAPALAGAHVGVAMQRGADIARLTADIALLEDDIGRVADAREISDNAMALIGSNYRATVGLNTGILLGAAFGVFPPIATALMHNGVTLAILMNALRPRKLSPRNNRPRNKSDLPHIDR